MNYFHFSRKNIAPLNFTEEETELVSAFNFERRSSSVFAFIFIAGCCDVIFYVGGRTCNCVSFCFCLQTFFSNCCRGIPRNTICIVSTRQEYGALLEACDSDCSLIERTNTRRRIFFLFIHVYRLTDVRCSRWLSGSVVTLSVIHTSMKFRYLCYLEPGWYWHGWPFTRILSWYLTRHPCQLSLAIPPWVGATSTDDGLLATTRRENCESCVALDPFQECWNTGLDSKRCWLLTHPAIRLT